MINQVIKQVQYRNKKKNTFPQYVFSLVCAFYREILDRVTSSGL